MLALGKCWASRLQGVLFFRGELGVGKTTLVRGILRGFGFVGAVPSPTYTLIEHYPLPRGDVYHIDLYRLNCADELEAIGFRDILHPSAIFLIEWPQRAAGYIPAADFEIEIQCIKGIKGGRRVQVTARDASVELPQP